MNKQNVQNTGGASTHLPISLLIEGRELEWTKQYITGKELRELAGLSADAELYLSIVDPWDDEKVDAETTVDLGREGIESFYVRRPLKFNVGDKEYQWKKQFITGAELRKLLGIDDDHEIVLLLHKPYEDEQVSMNTRVDLARPGIEHFKVKKKDEEIKVSIQINHKSYPITRGVHTVAVIKKLGGVPASDELSEVIDRKLVPLKDDGKVHIKGCEEFVSCKREGTSS